MDKKIELLAKENEILMKEELSNDENIKNTYKILSITQDLMKK